MAIEFTSELGSVQVSNEVIATIAGSAALDCYGLIGMASQNQLKDGIAELLGRDNLARGVEVRREEDELHIDLNVIVSYGTRISEVAQSIQNRVKYVINEVVGLRVDYVNVRVQGVRVV
jgi:uncharacterized alkaline shock family protein YloU